MHFWMENINKITCELVDCDGDCDCDCDWVPNFVFFLLYMSFWLVSQHECKCQEIAFLICF